MGIAAVVWLGYEFGRLLFGLGLKEGGVDLSMRQGEVKAWFRGDPVYGAILTAVYPPASYALLWPLVGWLGIGAARWLYALTAAAAVAWLVTLLVRVSGAESRTEKAFIGLIPLSCYATGAAIGNGQIIVYVLPCVMAALLLLFRGPSSLRKDLTASFLLFLALVKPSLAAPFVWVVLFAPGGLRPAFLTACGYLGVTALAVSFQEGGLLSLMDGFRTSTEQMSLRSGPMQHSHANLHAWLAARGLNRWIQPASLALFGGLGVWVYGHRRCDVWLLAAVAAMTARFWTYHGWYDDLLLVVPLVTLFRTARPSPAGTPGDPAAGILFAVTLLTLMAPGGLYLFPRPWNQAYVALQTVVWIALLLFLLSRARR
jgi:hypothetical protein